MTFRLSNPRTQTRVSAITPGTLENIAVLDLLLISALAWFGLFLLSGQEGGLVLCYIPGVLNTDRLLTVIIRELTFAPKGQIALEWILMVGAMMLPISIPHLTMLRARLYKNQQNLGVLSALAGYFLVWGAIGIIVCVLLVIFRVVHTLSGMDWMAPIFAYAIAIAWLIMPHRIKLIKQSHRVPILYNRNTQLAIEAFNYGIKSGVNCSKICLPIMIAPMFAGQGLIAMFAITHLLLSERLSMHTENRLGHAGIICLLAMLTLL